VRVLSPEKAEECDIAKVEEVDEEKFKEMIDKDEIYTKCLLNDGENVFRKNSKKLDDIIDIYY